MGRRTIDVLTELKGYLSERRTATLTEIARQLAAEPDAVRAMLDHWVRKGKVRRSAAERCNGCVGCAAADVEFYEWVDSPANSTARATPTTT